MTIQPPSGSDGAVPEPQQLLFTPGPRLGWTFRDRRSLCVPYREPPPDADMMRQQAAARLATAQRHWRRALMWALRPSLFILIALLALGGCAHALNPSASFGLTVITALILALPGTGWTLWRFAQYNLARDADPQRQHRIAWDGWQQRAAAHQQAELARYDGVPEWGSAVASSRRLDIFGGSPAGWRSLHVVHGASVMAEQPLLIADLTGQYAAADLAGLSRDAGVDVAEYVLPRDLDASGLLTQLAPRQLADALAEAIHAGAPGAARSDRAVDVRVLEQLCSALGTRVTPARLAAGVEAALGRTVAPGLLTGEETALIKGKLFGETYLPQISANLIRLDAFLADLAQHAGTGAPARSQPAYCTIFAAEPAARSARAEVIAALVVQWLTVMITASTTVIPAVVVAGADEITRGHLERLADACDRKQVPLTLLFRHLRDDSAALVGGGATAFMQLGNNREAEQAAAFIGRGYKFVLSGFTAAKGGDRTRTTGISETWGNSESRGFNSSSGWSRDHMLGGDSSSGSSGRSRDFSRNYAYGTEQSESEGANWSDIRTTERVYEYTVEPTVLQSLPDNALLLINRNTSASLQPVECDPAIVTFPNLTTRPHAPVPVPPLSPDQTAAPVPPAGQPVLTPPRPQPRWPAQPADDQPRPVQPPRRQPRSTPWWEQTPPPGQDS
jgi:hypothetical protein